MRLGLRADLPKLFDLVECSRRFGSEFELQAIFLM